MPRWDLTHSNRATPQERRIVRRVPNGVIHGDQVKATKQRRYLTELEHPAVQYPAAGLLRLALSV